MTAFNGQDVLRFFDDAQKISIPAWVCTDLTRISFRHLEAGGAEMNLAFQVADCGGK
jgi:hypothetical protein